MVSEPSIFRGYVSFKKGIIFKKKNILVSSTTLSKKPCSILAPSLGEWGVYQPGTASNSGNSPGNFTDYKVSFVILQQILGPWVLSNLLAAPYRWNLETWYYIHIETHFWKLSMEPKHDSFRQGFSFKLLLMAEIPNNHLRCIKAIVHNGIKLPVPQLVSLPDFWLPSSVSGFFDAHVSPRISGTEKIVGTRLYMGVSLNDGIPKSPQNDPFLVGKPHGFVGETHPFRSCPHKTLW